MFRYVTLAALFLTLAARALAQPAPAAKAPAWLGEVPALPSGWSLTAAEAEMATFSGGGARLVVARQSGAAADVAAALAGQLAADLGAKGRKHFVLLAGAWAKGTFASGQAGGAATQAVVAVRGLGGGRALSLVARGPMTGGAFADGVLFAGELRLAGEGLPAPLRLDLSDRPEARINPIGLFVRLPKGWKPRLEKGPGIFTMRGKPGRIVLRKAKAAAIRTLADLDGVMDEYSDDYAQPSLWHAPGHHRAWQLLELKGDEVVALREIHLIRFRKFGDWIYNTAEFTVSEPGRGAAPFRAIVSSLQLIP